MADYTVTIGTEQFDSGGSLTIPMPAGSLEGKLLLIYSAVQIFDGGAMTTPPSGYTELSSTQPGANKAAYLWGKIGTASEASKTVTWAAGQAAGWAIAIESTTGWPAIGSVLAGYNDGTTTSPSASLQYGARTVSADGNFAIQTGKRPSPGSPTAVAVTGTWASAGDMLNTTIAAAAQWKKTSGNIAANAVALTGGSGTNATGWITAEFVPAAASGPSITATDGTVQIGEAGLTHAPVAAGSEVFTASPAFSSAINGATLDPGGAAIDITSLLSSLSTSSATLTAPDVSLFRVGGAWNAIRWGVDYVIRFTDGTDTADVNCRFTAPVPTRFGAIVTPNATYHPGAAIATDESYGLFTVGEGTHNPADGDTTANIFVAGAATFQPFAYDLSAGNWIEGTAVPFADGASGGGALRGKLTMGRLAVGV